MYLNGSISILSKNGRYGAFNVGTLCTDIGDFVVKSVCATLRAYYRAEV